MSAHFMEQEQHRRAAGRSHGEGLGAGGEDGSDRSSTEQSDHASSDGGSSSPGDIARTETQLVNCSKGLVAFVLLLFTAISAFFTYRLTSSEEEEDFEAQFEDYGQELLEASVITASNVFSTIESMSVAITSYALATETKFPFVTIPHYSQRSSHLLKLSGSLYLGYSPLVTEVQRPFWETYSVSNQGWTLSEERITPYIWKGSFGSKFREDRPPTPYYAPFWQVTPSFPVQVNYNLFDLPSFQKVFDALIDTKAAILSDANFVVEASDNIFTWPQAFLAAPIFDTLDSNTRNVAAVYSAVIPFHHYLLNVIPEGTPGIYCVFENTCDQSFTYKITGPNATYVGPGDLHDTEYDHLVIESEFSALDYGDASLQNKTTTTCVYTMRVYPSDEFRESFDSGVPLIYTLVVVAIFAATSLVFVLYDCLVQHRQVKLLDAAARSAALVSTLFPSQVRDRLMDDAMIRRGITGAGNLVKGAAGAVVGGLAGDRHGSTLTMEKEQLLKSKPIADLFANCTVMFADISGFTAWASVREPAQVFTLLEQIYGSFDSLAKKRGVFKVETIGDCYVAVTGLPHPRDDHAMAMAKFARDCMFEMNETCNKLEVLLGPDTSELDIRVGLHSGPVTAGVLRGEKSRFQLFGDTVNTAGHMEGSGRRNRIHISQETANLLINAGKSNWIKNREELVSIKGKGDLQTYWLDFGVGSDTKGTAEELKLSDAEIKTMLGRDSSTDDMQSIVGGTLATTHTSIKTQRLIDWNVDVLQRLLKKIVAMREKGIIFRKANKGQASFRVTTAAGTTILDEVQEIITLPDKTAKYRQDPAQIELDPIVVTQLKNYVASIASMYRENSFHSFDHASHVTQSVIKLLSRVVTLESIDYTDMKYKKQGEAKLHEYTYGITSDPLTQFACAFSALIHDVDHTGVPNSQLIKEDSEIAKLYRYKSVAEQNSVDLAWELLNRYDYKELRECIYSTQEELSRFRKLVVNSVMATDIVDKELGALRKKRWETAFSPDRVSLTPEDERDDVNRKATIVIEHLIQASDVSHTMQHWHVYIKWNKKFFIECYQAYLDGRAEKDPSEGWYKGELGFFDFYIIPLAKKLKDCGCFGVSSDEYLNYAVANRREWELKGEGVVAEYLANFKMK